MDDTSSRSMPLLQSQTLSDRSLDKMDLHFQQANTLASQPSRHVPSAGAPGSHVSRAVLTRPRPEIVLRWKRFAVLVLLGAVLISIITVTLWIGIPLTDVAPDDAEDKVELFNSYSGVIMGFVESGVSQLFGYLFPVFIVYLHNVKWSRQDDPATRPISKLKKTALLLFVPLVMVAIGNSLSAVQTNQSGGGNSTDASQRQRRLTDFESRNEPSALDETALKTMARGATEHVAPNDIDTTDTQGEQLQRVAAGTRAAVGFPLRDWRDEVALTEDHERQEDSVRVTRGDGSSVRHSASAIVSRDTAVDLLVHGLTMFQQLSKDQRVELDLAETMPQLDALPASATPSDLLNAVSNVLGVADGLFNTSGMALQLSREPLLPHVQLQTLTLELPLVTKPTNATPAVSCGTTACVAFSADPLVRLRPLIAASAFSPACRSRQDNASCAIDTSAAFLFGSSVSAAAATAVSTDVAFTLTLTFAKLSWSFADSALELCSTTALDLQSRHTCAGLSLPLPRSRRHLILNAPLVPRLPASPSRPLRLVQIVQPPVVVGNDNTLATATLLDPTSRMVGGTSAVAAVDGFASSLRTRHLDGDTATMARTLRTTALLFLFQNAVVAPAAATAHVAWQRHLTTTDVSTGATATGTKEYQVYVANTRFGVIATWTACAILVVLSALVLLLPNARARLEPPKGGNARAERFVAVQTEEVYPNLVYKKRFRIGKTGEKIKFREFAVEAVTLHHMMEEDEQIEL